MNQLIKDQRAKGATAQLGDRRNGRYHFCEFQPVQDRGLARCVQAKHQDAHVLGAQHPLPHLAEEHAHAAEVPTDAGDAIWHEVRLEMLEPNTHGTTSEPSMPLHAPCHFMPQNCQQACNPPTIHCCVPQKDFVRSVGFRFTPALLHTTNNIVSCSCARHNASAWGSAALFWEKARALMQCQQHRNSTAAPRRCSSSVRFELLLPACPKLAAVHSGSFGGRDLALALGPSPLAARLHRPKTATLNKTRASGHPTSKLNPHAASRSPCPSFHLREDKVRDSQSRPS